jgi:hypothetical protein
MHRDGAGGSAALGVLQHLDVAVGVAGGQDRPSSRASPDPMYSFGTRGGTNGSAQISRVPWQRCSANTIFQFSNRMATRSPSSEK